MKMRFDLRSKTILLAGIPMLSLLASAIFMSGVGGQVAQGLAGERAIYRAFESRQDTFISSIDLMINLYYIPVEGVCTDGGAAVRSIGEESRAFVKRVKALQLSLLALSERPPQSYYQSAMAFEALSERILGAFGQKNKPTNLERDALLLSGWSTIARDLTALDTFLEKSNKQNNNHLVEQIQGSMKTILTLVAFNLALSIFLAIQYVQRIAKPALAIRRNSSMIGSESSLPEVYCDNDEFRDLYRALKFVHEELLFSSKKMHDLIDWSSALILSVDPNGTIKDSNKAAIYTLGIEPSALIGTDISDIFAATERGAVQDLLASTNEGLSSSNKRDYRLIDTQGKKIEAAIEATWNDRKQQFTLVIVDKSHENILTKSRNELKSMLSNDVREPLLQISTLIAECKSEAVICGPEARSAITAAQSNTTLMLELSAQLNDLYLKQIDQEEQKQIDVKTVIEESVELLAPLAKQKGVLLTTSLSLARAYGNRSQLVRLCNNLLANAVRFSPPGSTVSITMKNLDQDYLLFEIEDQGPGIKPENVASMFAPFVQDKAERGKNSGFGLGLSICRQIVQSYAGEIGHKPGQGSTGSIFWVKLPRYR